MKRKKKNLHAIKTAYFVVSMKFFNLAQLIENLNEGLPETKTKKEMNEQKEKKYISWYLLYLLDSSLILHDNTVSVHVKLTNHRIPLQCVCIVNCKCFTNSAQYTLNPLKRNLFHLFFLFVAYYPWIQPFALHPCPFVLFCLFIFVCFQLIATIHWTKAENKA